MNLKQIISEQDVDLGLKKAFDQEMAKLKTDFTKIASSVQVDMNNDAEVKAALKDAPPDLIKMVSDGIKHRNKVLKENGGKKTEEYKRLNEEAVTLISVVLALPRIVELIGKFVKSITVRMGGKGVVGQKMEKFGHDMHEMYEDILMVILKATLFKIPPFTSISDTQQKKIVKLILTTIVISLAVYSGTTAVNALKSNDAWKAAYEAVLTAVKGGENSVREFLGSAISKIITSGVFNI